MPKDPKDNNMPLGGQEPMLRAIRHKTRMRRKICYQARKERRQIKYPSPQHLMLNIHLANCIYEEMIPEQCQHNV